MSALSGLVQEVKQVESRFLEVAPKHINFTNELSFAVQILNNNSYLAGVATKNPNSLKSAVANIAAIGLSLNPAEKLAYLIPRSVKNGNQWEARIFLEPSYMGLCKLATDSGGIEWVQARCVYAEDEFIDNGLGEKPTHNYSPFSKDRGEFVGVYCTAKTDNGDYLTTTMGVDKILDIRGRSESWKKRPNSGVWHTDFEEQAKKTVVRNAFKMWPRTNDKLAQAVDMSNENMGFESIETTEPTIHEVSAAQKRYFDDLIEKNLALDMYIFKDSLVKNDNSISQWVNLVHSFPKGQKGKYGDIVNGLAVEGQKQYEQYLESFISSIENQDFSQIESIISEVSQDCTNKMIEELTPELSHAYRNEYLNNT